MAIRVQWPQAEIADRLGRVWARKTGGAPLRIVSGEIWVAGLVGVTAMDRPSMFTLGEFRLSPWITRERLEREGALVVWNARRPIVPDTLRPLIDAGRSGEERFKWPGGSRRPDLVIGYAIVPPR
jgi:hypothetical protein